jgi:CDP-diacylglycerol--serine O-phosphatidyltransferase
VVVLFFALLVSYPWEVLTVGTLAYLVCLPLGWLSYRNYQRRDAEAAATTVGTTDAPSVAPNVAPSAPLSGEIGPDGDDRPNRLN